MAGNRPNADRASDMYAQLGPSPAKATRNGLDAAQVSIEFRSWRDEYLTRWQAGEQVPEPPYADTLDTYK